MKRAEPEIIRALLGKPDVSSYNIDYVIGITYLFNCFVVVSQYILKVLTDAKPDRVLACVDGFAFGNLPCTLRRAAARIARYMAEDCESTYVRSNP